MGSIVLAYSPISDAATLTAGGYAAGLPRDNLKDERLFKVARTSDATTTNTKFTIDFGTATAVSALIVGPTNLSAAGQYRVRGSSSNSFPSGYTSGWLSHGVAAADIDVDAGLNIIHLLAAPETYRYWEVAIDDTANSDGFIEMGRLFVPRLLQPSINYGYGANGLMIEDRTRREETLSGVENRSRRRNRRVFTFGIDFLPEDEAFGSFLQFQRSVAFDKTVFVIPDPQASGARLQARSFWGTIGAMDPISQAAFGVAGVGLTIREQF